MSTLITTRAAGRANLTDAEACSPVRNRPPCAESQPPTEPTEPIEPIAAVGARLRIGREDIAWRTVAPGTVEVGFRIHNDGDRESAPTVAEVRSAPFGAHLDWTLLCEVDVPSIQAGGSLALSALARLENRVGWLPEPTADTEIQRARELAFRAWRILPRLVQDSATGLLASGRRPRHWIGNIDVHVAGAYAEKHCAKGVLAHAGCLNEAWLRIGSSRHVSRAETYEVHATITRPDAASGSASEALDWGWRLQPLERLGEEDAVSECNPTFELQGQTWCSLTFTPPEYETDGRLELHVKRLSSGRTAVVEFDLTMTDGGEQEVRPVDAARVPQRRINERLPEVEAERGPETAQAHAGLARRAWRSIRRLLGASRP